ncbi:carboxymuconolactone decarboxylase family protein [Methanoregula sp. UBA64]|jgi:4-carboxymuconolactone decarboxylase|uniref:carboxymuconolactone decarboxylase family protein n=1 Tax=Methanoregula sp. UBA64 TaxID=1915554 RepID=UPI0025F0D8CF|nr:carboxymuconolactone decarboxylase family protein [Methanoregula sp. UBA64]
MKEANKEAISEFLKHADSIGDDMLEDTQKMLGSMPFILPVQKNERPDYFALMCIADDMLCRPPNLSAKTAELVTLAAAAAAGAGPCLKFHIQAAAKEGATRGEIFDTIMIAALVGKTKILASALRDFSEAYP